MAINHKFPVLSTRNFQMMNGLLGNALQIAHFPMVKYSCIADQVDKVNVSVRGNGNYMDEGLESRENT